MDGLQRLKQMEEFETWKLWENIIATILENVFFGRCSGPTHSAVDSHSLKKCCDRPDRRHVFFSHGSVWTGRLEVYIDYIG